MVDAGEFRKDLYYRLNIIHLTLPPLRERKGDIPLLIEHFLSRFGAVYGKTRLPYCLTTEAEAILLQYDYPGNVRELENVMRRAVILCQDGCISSRHFPSEIKQEKIAPPTNSPMNFHEAKAKVVAEFERSYLTSILRFCGGIVCRAADCSGLSERNFHGKLKKYGLCGKDFRVLMSHK